ncbi:MAG TPA: hypothetical protein VD963_09500 [Phycisphaerales bacterium]|nr:hypothetical protein [Phycisphaerales bacterium]
MHNPLAAHADPVTIRTIPEPVGRSPEVLARGGDHLATLKSVRDEPRWGPSRVVVWAAMLIGLGVLVGVVIPFGIVASLVAALVATLLVLAIGIRANIHDNAEKRSWPTAMDLHLPSALPGQHPR